MVTYLFLLPVVFPSLALPSGSCLLDRPRVAMETLSVYVLPSPHWEYPLGFPLLCHVSPGQTQLTGRWRRSGSHYSIECGFLPGESGSVAFHSVPSWFLCRLGAWSSLRFSGCGRKKSAYCPHTPSFSHANLSTISLVSYRKKFTMIDLDSEFGSGFTTGALCALWISRLTSSGKESSVFQSVFLETCYVGLAASGGQLWLLGC